MEQAFQKQTTGCDRYLLRYITSAAGQGDCVVFCGQKNVPLCEPLYDTVMRALLDRVKDRTPDVKLYYYIPQSLCHYGEVDSLAPAGAMQEFVTYVQELEKEEAEEFFGELHKAFKDKAGAVHLVRSMLEWKTILRNLADNYGHIALFASHLTGNTAHVGSSLP